MQVTRQWMITQDWMVKGNRQSEWIEQNPLLLDFCQKRGQSNVRT